MKKFILSALVLTLFISNTYAFSGVGRGIQSDPYVISTCTQLGELLDDTDAHYRMVRHFSCDGVNLSPLTRPQYFKVLTEPVELKDNEFFMITEDSDTNLFAFHVHVTE